MKFLKDKIIILKTTKYSDAHLIVTGINPKGTRISTLAPAALKSKKRFGGGVLEPTHFVEISYERAKSEEQLPILKEAQLIESFDGLRTHYDKLNLGFYFLKIVEMTVQEADQGSEAMFSLLAHGLKSLEKAQDLVSFKKHFELKFLYTQGLLELTDEVTPFLKKKFSDFVIFRGGFEESVTYLRMKDSIREYLGNISI